MGSYKTYLKMNHQYMYYEYFKSKIILFNALCLINLVLNIYEFIIPFIIIIIIYIIYVYTKLLLSEKLYLRIKM